MPEGSGINLPARLSAALTEDRSPLITSCPLCSNSTHVQDIASLQGLVVIDVVEGTAISSLPHMVNVLRQRPSSFPSLLDAVHWARKSGELALYHCLC